MVQSRWRGTSPSSGRWGFGERGKLPNGDQTATRLLVQQRLNALNAPQAEGMQRERAAGSLAKQLCITLTE